MRFPRLTPFTATLGLAMALTAPTANAAVNLISNPQFLNNAEPWHLWNPAGANPSFGTFAAVAREASQIGGPGNLMQMVCEVFCPSTATWALSQTIDNLTTGNKYELSFYVAQFNRDPFDVMYDTLMNVDFGGQHIATNVSFPSGMSGQYDLDSNRYSISMQNVGNYLEYGNVHSMFTHVVADFTYTGTGPSADLTFLNQWASSPYPCAPCYDLVDYANPTLFDLGTPSPPPPVVVSEPSMLGTLALSLGAMGLVLRRRRQGPEAQFHSHEPSARVA